MKEERRLEIKQNEERQQELNELKVKTRNDIDDLVSELLASDIVKKLKESGKNYTEIGVLIEELKSENVKLRDDMNHFCKHPVVCRMGYKKHNKANKVVPATREDAEYGSVRCLECGKNIYTSNKKANPEYFDQYIHIAHYARGQFDAEYQERPIIDIPSGMYFKDVYNEYQSMLLDNTEKEMVQKVLTKYKKNEI